MRLNRVGLHVVCLVLHRCIVLDCSYWLARSDPNNSRDANAARADTALANAAKATPRRQESFDR